MLSDLLIGFSLLIHSAPIHRYDYKAQLLQLDMQPCKGRLLNKITFREEHHETFNKTKNVDNFENNMNTKYRLDLKNLVFFQL